MSHRGDCAEAFQSLANDLGINIGGSPHLARMRIEAIINVLMHNCSLPAKSKPRHIDLYPDPEIAVEVGMVRRMNDELAKPPIHINRINELHKLRSEDQWKIRDLESQAGKDKVIREFIEASDHERFHATDGDGGADSFGTLKEAVEFADNEIQGYRDEGEEEWNSCVEGVTVWVAVQRATAIDCADDDETPSVDYRMQGVPPGYK